MPEKKDFLEHLKSDTRVGIQIGAALVIGLFSTFMVIDPYILPPRYVVLFRIIRIVICLADVIIIIALRKGYFHRALELIGVYVCLSVGLAIVAMVQVSGGAMSPYYAGISLTIVGFGVAIPWQIRYCAINCGILYASYLLSSIFLSDIKQMSVFVNNNGFLLTNIVMSLTMTQINYKFRLNKFLSDKKILKANEDLKELDKAKSAFFANVSHELKTPMTLVVTPLEYAMEKVTLGATSVSIPLKLFETVRQNAHRLSSRISDLMDLTKNNVGKSVIHASEIQEPEGYFGRIFQSVLSLMEKKGISHEYSCDGGEPLKPHCFDKTKMDKVVVNLLTNAVKFTPKGGRISLRVWDELNQENGETALRFVVEDSGIGIPADKLSGVFERFVQVDSSSTRSYGGMGIGLSLVREFVDLHGGRVWVESQEGKGTKFFVELPRGRHHFRGSVAEVQAGDAGSGVDLPESSLIAVTGQSPVAKADERVETVSVGQVPRSEETILVVDDSSDMRLAVRQVLEDRYHVLEASDGEEGVRVVREKRPDLIISDIMMPQKDGYGLLQDVKSDPAMREIPVIFLTAKVGEENLARGFQFGADDYISKPFQPKEVLARVENLIRLRRQREEIARQRDELDRLNKALKEAQAELVQSEKLSTVGLLSAGVAHEIKNPVYALTLNVANIEKVLEQLRGSVPRGEIVNQVDHHLKRCMDELRRIKVVVNNLLDYSQKNLNVTARQSLEKDIENTLAMMKKLIDDSGIRIHWTPAKRPRTLEADHAALNLVFTNLIQNAIEAAARNVWIQVDGDTKTCRIELSDDGQGMTAEILPRVFEPFFTTREDGRSSGLGLNIVYRIVRAHDGDIRVTSKVGEGSKFSIVLPSSEGARRRKRASVSLPQPENVIRNQ